MNQNPLSAFEIVSPALSLLGAVLSASLFLSILRRARRDAEVVVLLCFSACLTLQLGLYCAGDWLYATAVIRAMLYRQLTSAADLMSLALLALLTHFLALTYLRVSRDRAGEPAVFLGMTERKLNFLAFVGLFYIVVVVATVLRLMGLATGFGGGFGVGFALGISPALQLMVVAEVERRMPEDQKRKVPPFLRFFLSSQWTSLSWQELSIRPNARPVSPTTTEDLTAEIKGLTVLFIWYVVVLVAYCLHELPLGGSPGFEKFWILAKHFGVPLGMLPLVYYKTQFLFFDVLIKRGLVICALFASSAVYFAAVFRVVLHSRQAVVVWALALAFVAAWLPLHGALNRVLDRYIFHRPDYAALLKRINADLPRFVESRALVDHVTQALRDTLSAEFVRFREEQVPRLEAAASVPVAMAGRTWGCLELGVRAWKQPYRSEDLQFAASVASGLAAMLDNFARQEEFQNQQRREAQLRELAARSELKALRAQINPHFLFNALNTLADLTRTEPRLAENLVVALAGMFRFALDATSRDEVPLGEEIAFVRCYLEIEQARFGDRLRFTIDVPAALDDHMIPPMLIQPLVENAVKHGISPRPAGGSVSVRAEPHDGLLRITVEDDGVGFDPAPTRPNAAHGIGLSNVRERIDKLSGPGSFQVRSAPSRGTAVSFEIAVNQYADHHR